MVQEGKIGRMDAARRLPEAIGGARMLVLIAWRKKWVRGTMSQLFLSKTVKNFANCMFSSGVATSSLHPPSVPQSSP